jgi:hypothetical protein
MGDIKKCREIIELIAARHRLNAKADVGAPAALSAIGSKRTVPDIACTRSQATNRKGDLNGPPKAGDKPQGNLVNRARSATSHHLFAQMLIGSNE